MSMNDGWLHLSQNFARGYGGTAIGDSGGPTFWTDPGTGQEVLVSITAWGDPKCINTGITHRIDTESSLQFIRDVINSLGAE
jgi:secreted trypsin-like serine protease